MKTTVLVAGSWGTALASVLADKGADVWIWTRNAEQAEEINTKHTNRKYLKEASLPNNIRATTSMELAVEGSTAIVLASPTGAMREVVKQLRPFLKPDMQLIHVAKGFETDSLKRMTEVIASELPEYDSKNIVVLSGPSHAEEVIRRLPTTVVVSALNMDAANAAQDLFINSNFRVYTNPDLAGVEIGGALKNIIAVGAGMSDGLGFGDNAKAALVTRGLMEITRLGVAMGANPMTFAGLAGLGDLIVTSTSKHSRNWRAGYALAQGQSVEEVLSSMGMVVEGIKTTKAVYSLSQQYHVSMPITVALYDVLFNHKKPIVAVQDLMARGKTHEMEDIANASLLSEKWME